MRAESKGTLEEAAGKRGEMIVVLSAKGGVGRTVLTVNLAVALSKNNLNIGILDGSFQFGDVCLALDLTPTFSMKEVVEGEAYLDKFALNGYMVRHSSGVKVLAAPERPEYADLITPELTSKVCDLMLANHQFVLVDTGAGLNERNLQMVEKADQIFVVTNLEMATIKNTKLLLETLDMLGLRGKTKLIVNRSNMESVIEASDISGILGDENPFYIPNQFQIVSQSINIGIPFVMNHGKTDIAKSVFKLAEQMISRREISVLKPKQQSIFQTLFHRTKAT